MKIGLIIWGICLGLGLQLSAQSSHYASQQVGAEAMMLGGAVLSGDKTSNSMAYYNPAALAFINEEFLTLNTSAARFESYVRRNALGERTESRTQRGNFYPQMSSGLLTHDTLRPYRFSFLVFSRQFALQDLNDRTEANIQGLLPNGQEAYYLAGFDFLDMVSETWGGLGGGYKLNDNWSIGANLFVSYRMQRYRHYIYARAYHRDSSAGTSHLSAYQQDQEMRLNDFRLHSKLALHGRWDKGWALGLSLAPPSLGLNGFSRFQKELIGQNIQGQTDYLYVDAKRLLATNYRSPWILGLGLSKKQGRNWLGFSAQYHSPIAPYRLLRDRPQPADAPNHYQSLPPNFLDLYNFANPVLNWSLGFNRQINAHWSWSMGYRSDYSYHRSPPELPGQNRLQSLNMNIHHFSGGLSRRSQRKILSLALSYGLAWQPKLPAAYNLSQPLAQLDQQAAERPMGSLSYHLLIAQLSYTYLFELQ